MKKLLFLFCLFSILHITTACSNQDEPITTIEAAISQLTEDEFESVGTHELKNPLIDDFRKFTFNVEVDNVAGQKVEFSFSDSWKDAIDSFDTTDRYRFGGGSEQNNVGENVAKHAQEFVFYSKGLNEESMKEALNTIIFEVNIDNDGEITTKEYKVGDLVEFN
ncbi:fructose/tagatose bisphosphate aldolase [Solibacillus silvestris StLB046]|uniref:Fructose/tagatose bisphosphate aldolase n=1 Tax=Solibacillus silvestris (strain StLB046) TaxID=1002809 RepID=F2FAA7_SOLSS|nr:hypothetical protein [Solibacillus silvestris]BAK16242.1 fructose/tagatose bisphosphate aldolase [Solibacillus silvestris StLB046]